MSPAPGITSGNTQEGKKDVTFRKVIEGLLLTAMWESG